MGRSYLGKACIMDEARAASKRNQSMPTLTLDQFTINKMKAFDVGVEVRDSQGNLIGFFHPAITPADVDQYECPVREAEVLRRAGEGGGRALADILDDLRNRS